MSLLIQEANDPLTAPERLIELSSIVALRPLIAANVGTPSEHLEALSRDESEQVRQAVAQNPNISLDCLLHLAGEFPDAFFLNPLCSLLNLAQPGWYERIQDVTWLALLKSARIPRYLLEWIEERKRHKNTNNSSLRQPQDSYGVWIAARLHIGMPELHAQGEHIGRELAQSLAIVARHEYTPAPLLRELASIVCRYASLAEIGSAVCEQIRREVAQNPAAPGEVLRMLAQDTDAIVRHRVGKNSHLPVAILAILATDTSPYVRSGVAANEATPREILTRLALDTLYEEKYEQAQQYTAPDDMSARTGRMQMQEALNNIKLVKGALAGNPSTPLHILLHLASHTEVTVRERLAANPVIPEGVLRQLATDVERVVEVVVEHPRLPAEALASLASPRHSTKVRKSVAHHRQTPAPVLAGLAGDSEMRVREAVASNQHTPIASLEILAGDQDSLVRAAVAKNAVTPPEILARLVSDQTHAVRLALAQNTKLPLAVIEQLAEDGRRDVREQLICHPFLPFSLLEKMACDGDSVVQTRAQRRLERLALLGERGQQRYLYRHDSDHTNEAAVKDGVCASIPLYEIQAQALEYTTSTRHNPYRLREFLDRLQLPAELQQEILELLLPAWSQKWREHSEENASWLALLAEIDFSPAWQRTFAGSPLWLERYIMAVKPGIASDLLAQLAEDGNRYVRAAARWYVQQRQASHQEDSAEK